MYILEGEKIIHIALIFANICCRVTFAGFPLEILTFMMMHSFQDL
jgi:hypothetical protein